VLVAEHSAAADCCNWPPVNIETQQAEEHVWQLNFEEANG